MSQGIKKGEQYVVLLIATELLASRNEGVEAPGNEEREIGIQFLKTKDGRQEAVWKVICGE